MCIFTFFFIYKCVVFSFIVSWKGIWGIILFFWRKFIPFAVFCISPLCCRHTNFHFGELALFWSCCYRFIHLEMLQIEILWNSVCFDSNFKEWLRKASPSLSLYKDLCIFLSWGGQRGLGKCAPGQQSHTKAVLFWLGPAFPKELNTHSLPAFLLLSFWCHSVISKERKEPLNCFSPFQSKAELVADDDTCWKDIKYN